MPEFDYIMKTRIGFVGIGAMGAGMAANLRKKDFPVTFLARESARGREAGTRLQQCGANAAANLSELARSSDIVILCLPDSRAVEAVLAADAGLVGHLAAGTLIVDCSTSHPESTQRLARDLARRNLVQLDGPLTGSRVQAEAGTVTVLGAGPKEAFERVRPVLEGFAGHVFHLGGSGAGHTAKLINNFLGQLVLAGLCEAWPLIEKYGVDPQALFDGISVSGGNSAAFQGFFPRLRQRDFALNFAQGLARKDIRYFNELEQSAYRKAPLAASLLAIHDRATSAGFGDKDITSLLEFYEQVRE